MHADRLLVGEIFTRAAEAVPDRLAAALGSEEMTFGRLRRAADRCRSMLRDLGVGRGDRIGAWAELSLDLLPLFVASADLGVAFVPFDPGATPGEVARSLDRVEIRWLFVDRARVSSAAVLDVDSVLLEIPPETRRDPTPGEEIPERDEGVAETDEQVVFLTSGSTGEPRGVVLTHRTQWLRSTAGPLPQARGTTVCMFPLFHMAGWLVGLQCWQAFAPVVFVGRPDAESIWTAVRRHHADRLYCIPAVWRRLLDADPDGRHGASLRVVDTGTSATPPELLEELRRRYPRARRRVFYGSTEAGPVTMLDEDEVDGRPGSVGRPLPGVDLRTGATGELEIRGLYLFEGYLDGDGRLDRALTADGWYRTGDLAERDDGCWSMIGRARQVIRTGGETVAPPEVERVLDGVEGVRESAVIGLPDAEWGEIVVAVVVPEGPSDAGAASLLERLEATCERSLSKAKRPRRYEFTSALPRTTATGQIRRSLLVEQLVTATPPRRDTT